MNRKEFLRSLAAGGAALAGAPLLFAGAGDPKGAIASTPFRPRRRQGPKRFTLLSAGETGLTADNPYDDPKMWGALHAVAENGSFGTGVAVGDYDGDGRPDLFVVCKTRSCRLYRNLGDYRFEDVTEKAGLLQTGEEAAVWKQGATWVDIDNNGLLDLYVCRYNAPNLLYINQGDGTFREEASKWGLDVKDACVMAAFCDYDLDGRLDVFIQTNILDSAHPAGQRDYLFHNEGNGTFVDVSEKAGIRGEAQGHSAVWWDYNEDGLPDLYVANDFAAPDKLYRNNGDGTFTDVISKVVPHMPYSAMGSDLGDVNNDGRIDLIVTEMAATTHQKDLRTMAQMRALLTDLPDDSKAAPQVMRNTLYVNTGTGRCLEAACLAGVAATDWTWSVRMEDLDNDGRIDLFFTNGMNRELHNADLEVRKELAESTAEKVLIEKASPPLAEQHLAFRNLGDLRFEEVGKAWGLDQKGISFGTALGDFSGTGNLDVVYANHDGPVSFFRNDSDDGHSVIVELRGVRSNRYGVGATVFVETEAGTQVRSLVLARGILSSSEPVLHFGLGSHTRIRKLTVRWPSGHRQEFENLAADHRHVVTEPAGDPRPGAAWETLGHGTGLFADQSEAWGFALDSREAPVDELVQEPLIPQRQNRRGPALVVADLDGDGREEVVIGGTGVVPTRMVSPGPTPGGAVVLPSPQEGLNDGPILALDLGDGTPALLLTRSGVALPAGSAAYQPRLLLGNSRGGFHVAPDGLLPSFAESVGAVAAADFDRSGRLGVFLGGRVVPGQYPLAPRSALWANRGGHFEDVTDGLAPQLRTVGMVTGAVWSDVDGDGWPDLVLTLEWGYVRYFHNNRGQGFEDWTEKAGFAAAGKGWWTSIAAADLNGDGRPDFVVGNVGLNTPYRASDSQPAVILVGDFKGNADPQVVEAVVEGDRLYPWRTRKDLAAVFPWILKRYPRNDYFARATLEDIFGADRIKAAQRFEATQFQSGVFLSQPDGTYRFEPLPRSAQIAPVQGLVAADLNGDGKAEVCLVHNSYAPIPYVGRFDGGLGLMLEGDGTGRLEVVEPSSSGIVVPGDAKALVLADPDGDGWPDLLVSRNNGSTLALQDRGIQERHSLCIRLKGRRGNAQAIGSRVILTCREGQTQTAEIYAGSGYFSQSVAACFFGWSQANPPVRADVRWPDGTASSHPLSGNAPVRVLSQPT